MGVLLFGIPAYAGRSSVPHVSQSGHIAGGIETDKPSIFFLDGVYVALPSLGLNIIGAFQIFLDPVS